MDIEEFETTGVPLISVNALPAEKNSRKPYRIDVQLNKVSGVEWSFENYAMLLSLAIRAFAYHFKENIDESIWHIHHTIKSNKKAVWETDVGDADKKEEPE